MCPAIPREEDVQPHRPWCPADALAAILQLVRDPVHWLRDDDMAFARDRDGRPCSAQSRDATRFSWRGAVFRLVPSMERRQLVFSALDAVDGRIARINVTRGSVLSHREVICALEDAISYQQRLLRKGD